MKDKKFFSILIVLFASFLSISSYDALMIENNNIKINYTVTFLKQEENSNPGNPGDKNNGKDTRYDSDNSNGSGVWCSKFNSIWFVIGRILQVIYVAVPLLLIVTGAISFLKAVTSKDNNALSKAQKSLVNKIIAAVLVFLLMPLTKIALSFVADEGWYDCAKCVFEPSDDCMDENITTG